MEDLIRSVTDITLAIETMDQQRWHACFKARAAGASERQLAAAMNLPKTTLRRQLAQRFPVAERYTEPPEPLASFRIAARLGCLPRDERERLLDWLAVVGVPRRRLFRTAWHVLELHEHPITAPSSHETGFGALSRRD